MMTTVRRRSQWYWLRWGIKMLLTYSILIFVALILVTPFAYMVSISVRPGFSFMTFPLSIIPEKVSLENYAILFDQSRIARWIWPIWRIFCRKRR